MRRKKDSTASPKNPVDRFDALIAGGGLSGLCMAARLGAKGLRVCVIERQERAALTAPRFDTRTTALAYGSTLILDDCGIWDRLKDGACPIDDIRVTDQAALPRIDFAASEVGSTPFGYIVENAPFRRAVFERLDALSSVRLLCPAVISGIQTTPSPPRRRGAHFFITEPNGMPAFAGMNEEITVTLNNGQSLSAPLLIAADGRHSICREKAGIRTREWSYNQSALVATLSHSNPHHNLALENFHPGGPFALLPMTQNRSALVWCEPPEAAQALMRLPEQAFLALLKERGGAHLGDIRLEGGRALYPLAFMLAGRLTGPRLALTGEAAHGMHPIAGQGFNLSLRDIDTLGELVTAAAQTGGDTGAPELLDEYAARRHLDHFAFMASTDILEKLFSNNITPLRLARQFGLGLVERLPPARHFFSRMAMGLTGDANACR